MNNNYQESCAKISDNAIINKNIKKKDVRNSWIKKVKWN